MTRRVWGLMAMLVLMIMAVGVTDAWAGGRTPGENLKYQVYASKT